MALLMFVVYIFTWVLRGGSAIDAVRLCSMYLYVMPPLLVVYTPWIVLVLFVFVFSVFTLCSCVSFCTFFHVV